MGPDGKSQLQGAKSNELAIQDADFPCNKEAADACPVNVIHIFDKGGKKLV